MPQGQRERDRAYPRAPEVRYRTRSASAPLKRPRPCQRASPVSNREARVRPALWRDVIMHDHIHSKRTERYENDYNSRLGRCPAAFRAVMADVKVALPGVSRHCRLKLLMAGRGWSNEKKPRPIVRAGLGGASLTRRSCAAATTAGCSLRHPRRRTGWRRSAR